MEKVDPSFGKCEEDELNLMRAHIHARVLHERRQNLEINVAIDHGESAQIAAELAQDVRIDRPLNQLQTPLVSVHRL